MDDSTLKTLETESEETWRNVLEEYRFVFIRYLEIVKELLNFEKDIGCVMALKQFLAGDWDPSDPTIEAKAADGNKILYYRYGANHSVLGFERAIRQFEADLLVVRDQEKSLWKTLTQTVSKIDPKVDYVGYDNASEVWCHDCAEKQRALMIDDILSFDRVKHYEKELKKYCQKPLLPRAQEVIFNFYCDNYVLI